MERILHFSRITQRVVDIKSHLYRGSNAPLEQPEEEEEEEEQIIGHKEGIKKENEKG